LRYLFIAAIAAFCCFTSQAYSQGNKAYLFICNGGQYVERGSKTPVKEFFSASITFTPKEQTSEVLVGSKNNQIIGQRDAMYFDGLAFEDNNVVTGFMSDNPETSDYWSLYLDDGWALISLEDIILKADNCIEMGVSTDKSELSTEPKGANELDKQNKTNDPNNKQAVKWYRKAAEQGDAGAQYNLGVMYGTGQGVQQDHKQAVKWFRMAAEQGDAKAQAYLGESYDNGQGVPQDYKQAVKWYRKAAEQGVAMAQYSLAMRYGRGEGVTQDYIQAHKWFNIAGASGYEVATKGRDLAASMMNPAQIAEAQKLSRGWMEQHP
jgi:TPR repeat protein